MFYLSIAAILLLFLSVAPLTPVALSLPLSGLFPFYQPCCLPLPTLLFTNSISRHNDYSKRIRILIVTLIYNKKYSNHSTSCILWIHINRIYNTKYSYISLTNFSHIINRIHILIVTLIYNTKYSNHSTSWRACWEIIIRSICPLLHINFQRQLQSSITNTSSHSFKKTLASLTFVSGSGHLQSPHAIDWLRFFLFLCNGTRTLTAVDTAYQERARQLDKYWHQTPCILNCVWRGLDRRGRGLTQQGYHL